MSISVQPATPGARGVDCITVLSSASAARLKAAGISFAVRYLGSLTVAERDAILGAGLALLAVGFSRKPGWSPTGALGAQDGAAAALHAEAAGLPTGMHLFCDLEGPAGGTHPDDTIAYVNAWAAAVSAAGYLPGLYVGFACGLTPQQLYESLHVACYWHSCSSVPEVATRGYAMIQDVHANQVIAGVQVDVDIVQADKLGGVPYWLVADVAAVAHAAIGQAVAELDEPFHDNTPPDAA